MSSLNIDFNYWQKTKEFLGFDWSNKLKVWLVRDKWHTFTWLSCSKVWLCQFYIFWNSSILATWCKELTHLERPCCWERLKVGEDGDDRGWDGYMASPTRWTWVCVNSGSWWWTGGLVCCMQSMGSKESDTTEQLNWTVLFFKKKVNLIVTTLLKNFLLPLKQKSKHYNFKTNFFTILP